MSLHTAATVMLLSLCVRCALFIVFSLSSQVRLQTQPKPKPGESLVYAGTMDCFKKTLAKEVRDACWRDLWDVLD